MNTVAFVVFWVSFGALGHSYVLYPLLMRWLARGRAGSAPILPADQREWPRVALLMAAYNEEKVIAAKMESILQLRYPADRLRIYIGSDCSSDATPAIVREAQARSHWAGFEFFDFQTRRGKPPIINDLAAAARPHADIFLLTDASVMHHPDSLQMLVRHFVDPKIGAVDAHMQTVGLQNDGISRSEDRYLSGEVLLKHNESKAWGMMIGPFGGCYALRADCFEPIPPNTLVDDFWLVFRTLERGYKAINDLDAHCYEGATHQVAHEYKRKKRIATGSFQNMARFSRWIWPTNRLGFAFFSHKVLRWLGGFLLLGMWLASGWLALSSAFYLLIWAGLTIFLVGIPVLNWQLLRTTGRTPFVVRTIAYFVSMNLALIHGFWAWLQGVRTSVWQRTER
jgi:cellulose synthase/poly-beta-1,6-N-acetylglucosamine synthase-like glycosyltransferase